MGIRGCWGSQGPELMIALAVSYALWLSEFIATGGSSSIFFNYLMSRTVVNYRQPQEVYWLVIPLTDE